MRGFAGLCLTTRPPRRVARVSLSKETPTSAYPHASVDRPASWPTLGRPVRPYCRASPKERSAPLKTCKRAIKVVRSSAGRVSAPRSSREPVRPRMARLGTAHRGPEVSGPSAEASRQQNGLREPSWAMTDGCDLPPAGSRRKVRVGDVLTVADQGDMRLCAIQIAYADGLITRLHEAAEYLAGKS